MNSDLSLADVAAVSGNGNGMFGDGNGSFALLILFLFAMMGGNWGNWGGNGNGALTNDVQRGFDQQALSTGIADVNQAVANLAMANQLGFSNVGNGISDLKFTVATEACANRTATAAGLRDIQDSISNGIQTVLTQMCNDKIDAKNERIAQLQTELNMATLRESQNAQTAQILANNNAQTQALEQYLNPSPIPAYVVQNPNGCGCNTSCGCGSF